MVETSDSGMAVATMRAADFEPLEPFESPDQPWRCRCLTCGRVVSPRLSTLDACRGCKYCATKGLDLNAPAVVFVLTHPRLNAHMFGFDAADGTTKAEYERHGWEVYRSASVPSVEDAYEIEAAVLRWLRLDLALSEALAADERPADTRGATVRAEVIPVAEVWSRASSELSRRRRRRRAAGSARGSR